jgi:CheY-like chemotaxis protein
LIDDEELVVSVASEILGALGYQVVTSQRSSDALELFRSQPELFQLIITDQTMPGMTGLDLAKEFQQIRADIPIILCTGFSDEDIGKKAQNLRIRKILSKPFVINELAATIREILDSR